MNAVPHPAAVERAMSAAMSLIASLGDDAEDTLKLDMLEGETDALEIVRRLIRAALDAESMAEAAKRRVNDLEARRDRFYQRAEQARETVKQMLDALGVNRVVDSEFTVSLKMGPPKVLVTEPEKLADEFWRIQTTRTVDKPLVKAAIDAGRAVEGAVLSNGGQPVLQVRTK
jgi:hypothetical protein